MKINGIYGLNGTFGIGYKNIKITLTPKEKLYIENLLIKDLSWMRKKSEIQKSLMKKFNIT